MNHKELCLVRYPGGEKLFFNRWFEKGEGVDYKYWEETIVRDLNGNAIDLDVREKSSRDTVSARSGISRFSLS